MIRTHAVNGALLCLTLVARPAAAQWTIEVFGGTSQSLPTPLTFHQRGLPDISLTAHYETRPFYSAPYYAYRIGYWRENSALMFEFIHHKVYLQNPPANVQHFEITHGYNLFVITRGWRKGRHTILTLGAGPIIGHPESEVRGRKFPEDGRGMFSDGYFFAGGTVVGGLGQRYHLTKDLFVSGEAKLSASYAHMPIQGGHAVVPNVAAHFHLGVGLEL